MKKISLFLMLAAALGFGVIVPAQSTPISTSISTTIGLGTVYTGATPDGSGPWLTATFNSTGSTTGTLTLTSNLNSTDILQGLNNSHGAIGWAFYLNQSLASLKCESGGTCADNGALFGGSYNTGPLNHIGTFNLAFGWSSGNRFAAGDSAVYDLTFENALTGNPFGPNGSDWWSVAHVQQISGACGDSGWIVYGTGSGASNAGPCGGTPPPHNVPEPTALGMFGFGVLLIGLFLGLRRRVV